MNSFIIDITRIKYLSVLFNFLTFPTDALINQCTKAINIDHCAHDKTTKITDDLKYSCTKNTKSVEELIYF